MDNEPSTTNSGLRSQDPSVDDGAGAMQQVVAPDAAAATACPQCGASLGAPSGRVAFVDGLGFVGEQDCAACGAHWRYPAPDPAPKKRSRWRVILAVCGVVVIGAAGVMVGIALRGGGSSFPSAWDPQVAPIAARVAALRDLPFKHPVKVNYLSAPAFEKKVTTSPADLKKQAKQIQQSTGLLRAAGLLGADVDLADAVNTTQAADTDAFYDEHTKQIYINGTGPLTVATRVTLAHELTHVLQDQNFDLVKLQKRADASASGSSDALSALIEGDAGRIEDEYVAALSSVDQREYERLSTQASNQASQRTRHVAAVVGSVFGAPYTFGPPVVTVLETGGGNAAVNAALTGPTPSTRIYFDPTAVNDTPAIPPVPALTPGEHKLKLSSGNDTGFDNFTFYLMLAARIDRPAALLAADAYASGSEADYTQAGATCFRAAIVGQNAPSTAFLASMMQRWSHTMPDAAVEATTGPVVFHTCDPGAQAHTPSDASINQATVLLATRDQLVASVAGRLVPAKLAACMARVLVEQPDFRNALLKVTDPLSSPTQQMLSESVDAGVACHNNQLAGLPNGTP
jgi:hypothetical protein